MPSLKVSPETKILNRSYKSASVIKCLCQHLSEQGVLEGMTRPFQAFLTLSVPSAELIKPRAPTHCASPPPALLRKSHHCQKSHTNKRCTWAALALFTLGKKLSLSNPGHTCAKVPQGLLCLGGTHLKPKVF